MIKNFESVKAQLSELAGVINSFKSEAVQLRIIELILGAPQHDDLPGYTDTGKVPPGRIKEHRKTKTKKAVKAANQKKQKMTAGTGAVATLTQLAGKNFFEKPRTLKDIIEHCKQHLARSFKANEFSGKLGRMVRNGELTRKKNADNQYEYKKP